MTFYDFIKTMDHSQTTQRQVKVQMDEGLHIRPCSVISKLVFDLTCEVSITHEDRKADAKSSLDLLGLGAPKGVILTIEATGEGAEEIVEKIVALFETKFENLEND